MTFRLYLFLARHNFQYQHYLYFDFYLMNITLLNLNYLYNKLYYYHSKLQISVLFL